MEFLQASSEFLVAEDDLRIEVGGVEGAGFSGRGPPGCCESMREAGPPRLRPGRHRNRPDTAFRNFSPEDDRSFTSSGAPVTCAGSTTAL